MTKTRREQSMLHIFSNRPPSLEASGFAKASVFALQATPGQDAGQVGGQAHSPGENSRVLHFIVKKSRGIKWNEL